MKREESKTIVELLKHYSRSRNQTTSTTESALSGYTGGLRSTQKLWKQGSKSFLIKAGIAMIAFPDPTISDVIGSAMVAAGLIQMKMRNSALHVDDVYKTFPRVVKELGKIKERVI